MFSRLLGCCAMQNGATIISTEFAQACIDIAVKLAKLTANEVTMLLHNGMRRDLGVTTFAISSRVINPITDEIAITDDQLSQICECFKLIGHHSYSSSVIKSGSIISKGLTQLIHVLLSNVSAIYFHKSDLGSTGWSNLSKSNKKALLSYFSSDSSFLATCGADLIEIIGKTLSALNNANALNSNIPSEHQHSLNSSYISQRELMYSNNVVYTLEMSYSQCVLKALETEDVEGALTAFNNIFCKTTLPCINDLSAMSKAKAKVSQLHALMREEFKSTDCIYQPILSNFINGCIMVDSLMDKCRVENDLTLHQFWHAADVFLDLDFLLNEKNSVASPIHILLILCGLFHDSDFTRNRVFDEIKSAYHLVHFLEPILLQLSPQQQITLTNIIHVIFTNTVPCILDKRHDGEPNEVIIGLIALIMEQSPGDVPLNPLVKHAAEIIEMVDVRRYSIPQLHKKITNYESFEWAQLGITDVAEKVQMSQSFRALAELGAKSKKDNIMFFDKAIAYFQGNEEHRLVSVSQVDIDHLANAIQAEMAFAPRAANSLGNNVLDLNVADVKEAANKHVATLNRIHQYLIDKSLPLEVKNDYILLFAKLASEQASKAALNIETLHQMCMYIHRSISQSPSKCCAMF